MYINKMSVSQTEKGQREVHLRKCPSSVISYSVTYGYTSIIITSTIYQNEENCVS